MGRAAYLCCPQDASLCVPRTLESPPHRGRFTLFPLIFVWPGTFSSSVTQMAPLQGSSVIPCLKCPLSPVPFHLTLLFFFWLVLTFILIEFEIYRKLHEEDKYSCNSFM